jgi:hypothetical protein
VPENLRYSYYRCLTGKAYCQCICSQRSPEEKILSVLPQIKGPFLAGRLIYGAGIRMRSAFVCVFKTLILGRGNTLSVMEKKRKGKFLFTAQQAKRVTPAHRTGEIFPWKRPGKGAKKYRETAWETPCKMFFE